jgi:hypothetical protein
MARPVEGGIGEEQEDKQKELEGTAKYVLNFTLVIAYSLAPFFSLIMPKFSGVAGKYQRTLYRGGPSQKAASQGGCT